MHIVMVGPFGLGPKQTMRSRALPMAEALTRRGLQVTILLPPWSNPQDAGSTLQHGAVRIINLKLPQRIPVLFQASLGLSLLRHALALKPDVIHCFKPKAYSGAVAWCVWQLRRAHMLHTRLVVDSDDWEGPGGWNDREPYGWPLKRLFAWQERWGLRHADALTLASRALQTIAWSLGIPPERVHYVPNGVRRVANASESRPRVQAEQQTAEWQPTLLLYTRFFEFGLARIVRLFARLAEREPDLRFLIVGQGLFGEEKEFFRLLNDAHVYERVNWLGMLPEEGLSLAFTQSTLAVYPFDDTLLNRTKCAVKLTDLLGAGVPVVAEAVGQNAEYIVHGESGLLVCPGDEAALCAAVGQLLHDEPLRRRIGEAARRRMCEHFSWDDLVGEVEAAYGHRPPATTLVR